MTEQEIIQNLKSVFDEVFDGKIEFSTELTKENEEAWDSVEHIRFALALEEKFDVTFSLDELDEITSIKDVVKILQNGN